MPEYKGSCHCGAVSYRFTGPEITEGLRCNCSVCIKKGALMSPFTSKQSEVALEITGDALGTYQFGSKRAKHHFCKICGIYPFHQPFSKPDEFRFNLGCLSGVDVLGLPVKIIDGASI